MTALIKDFVKTVRKGAERDDKPILAFMLGLLFLSLTLIVYGLFK